MNECVESCININEYSFAEQIATGDTEHLPCLDSCPYNKQYYSETEKICKTSCGNNELYSSTNDHIWISSCKDGEKISNENRNSVAICSNGQYLITVSGNGKLIDYCFSSCNGSMQTAITSTVLSDYKFK